MIEAIEYERIVWHDHAGDKSAVDVRNEGEWWKVQYQLEGDDEVTVAYLPKTLSIVKTADIAAANARIAELERRVEELGESQLSAAYWSLLGLPSTTGLVEEIKARTEMMNRADRIAELEAQVAELKAHTLPAPLEEMVKLWEAVERINSSQNGYGLELYSADHEGCWSFTNNSPHTCYPNLRAALIALADYPHSQGSKAKQVGRD